jgi:hypothetical protein
LEAAHFQGMLALIDEQLLIDELEPKPKPKGPEIRRDHCQHGRKQSEPVRRMRHGLLPARAPEEPVQGLRYGLLPVRAPEEQVQGLQPVPLLPAQAPAGQVQGLRHRQIGSRFCQTGELVSWVQWAACPAPQWRYLDAALYGRNSPASLASKGSLVSLAFPCALQAIVGRQRSLAHGEIRCQSG